MSAKGTLRRDPSGAPRKSIRFYVTEEEGAWLEQQLTKRRIDLGLIDETCAKGDLITVNEASIIALRSRQTIQKYCEQGRIACLEIGDRYFVYEAAAQALRETARARTDGGI